VLTMWMFCFHQIKMFYNDLTSDQVRKFKLYSQDDMQGVRSSSRMFYACLACTIHFETGRMEGEDHHPVYKNNPKYISMEEEYLYLLNDKHETQLKSHQSGVECHSPGAMSAGDTTDHQPRRSTILTRWKLDQQSARLISYCMEPEHCPWMVLPVGMMMMSSNWPR